MLQLSTLESKYVSSTKDLSLYYGTKSESIIGYTDSDWAGDRDGRKSINGFVFNYLGASFAWSRKRQTEVAASSVEAEYIAQARCIHEALEVQKLMIDFGIDDAKVDIRADNHGAIALPKSLKSSAATKQIDVAYHLQRDYIDKGSVKLSFISSAKMVADGMTKPLGKQKLIENAIFYGLVARGSRTGSV